MKYYLHLLFILIVGSSTIVSANDTLIVTPNKGINNVELLKTKPSEIKKYRGKIYTKKVYTSMRCGNSNGVRTKTTTYYNKDSGISFVFKQKEIIQFPVIWSKAYLDEIEIEGFVALSNSLVVGQSSKKEVLSVYGSLPDGRDLKSYIIYGDIGIAFDFDENDILKKVTIF